MEPVDWVTARAGCTAQNMFLKIREEVRRDVDTRNNLRPQGAAFGFRFQDNGDTFRSLY